MYSHFPNKISTLDGENQHSTFTVVQCSKQMNLKIQLNGNTELKGSKALSTTWQKWLLEHTPHVLWGNFFYGVFKEPPPPLSALCDFPKITKATQFQEFLGYSEDVFKALSVQ